MCGRASNLLEIHYVLRCLRILLEYALFSQRPYKYLLSYPHCMLWLLPPVVAWKISAVESGQAIPSKVVHKL